MTVFGEDVLMREGGVCGSCRYPTALEDASGYNRQKYSAFATLPEQTHSCNVGIVQSPDQEFPDTDALVTFERNLSVGVVTADCVPILLYAPDIEAIAAVHAGWRGTLGGIVDNVLDVLEKHGAALKNLKVAFGPSISKDVYEVSEELAEKFIEVGFDEFVHRPNGKENRPHIDLQGVNMERFLRRGVSKSNINLCDACTFSSVDSNGRPLYQSYRRNGSQSGRILTFIYR